MAKPKLRHDVSHTAMINRLMDLIEEAKALPTTSRTLSLKLSVLKEINAICGLHVSTHNHLSQERVVVQLVPLRDEKEPPSQIEPSPIIEDLPQEKDPYTPPADPVRYSLGELLQDDSEEDPEGSDPA